MSIVNIPSFGRRQHPTWSYRRTPEETELAALRLIGWLLWVPVMVVLTIAAWPFAAIWAAWKTGMIARRRIRRNRGLSGRTILGRR